MIKRKHCLFLLFCSVIYSNKIICGDNTNNTNKLYHFFMTKQPVMVDQQKKAVPGSPKGWKNHHSNEKELGLNKKNLCIFGCICNFFILNNNGFYGGNRSFFGSV